MDETKTVVIVEDEFLIANYLEGLCEDMGVKVLGLASKAGQAIELLERTDPESGCSAQALNVTTPWLFVIALILMQRRRRT